MSKLNITVCMGSSCFARGNQQNLAFIESFIQEHGLEAEINLAGSRRSEEHTSELQSHA